MNSSLTKICIVTAAAAILYGLSSCNGILSNAYDEPEEKESVETRAGQLYVDASEWGMWHYIDLKEVYEATENDAAVNPSALWKHYEIPITPVEQTEYGKDKPGIYTYWYDVFGEGISKNEFRDFYLTIAQPEPEKWSFAVHRNNVRTNGGEVARTDYHKFEDLPEGTSWTEKLKFHKDEWNEKDVWTIQERMLSGLIGNQGIEINNTLSAWLTIEIPPMPPAFTHNDEIFILKLADGSMAALQLENYLSSTGTKCCLTINYRYPL